MKTLIFVAAISVSSFAHAQDPLPATPIKTTLCEIKAHPDQFQHKLVEFTAIASHGFEDSMVEDINCQ